jgi:hypothetical protein
MKSLQHAPLKESKLIISLKACLIFLFVFNLSFAECPLLTTGRVSLIVLLILYGKKAFSLLMIEFGQSKFYFMSILLLLFAIVWWLANDCEDSILMSRAFWFIIYSGLGLFLYVCMAKFSLLSAMLYYLLAMLFQAMCIFATIIDVNFYTWTVEHLPAVSDNIDYGRNFVRFKGLSNGGGSALSVQLSLGVIAAYILFLRSHYAKQKILLLICAIVITVSTVFVGRTGLLISLFFLAGFVIHSGRAYYVSIPLLFIIIACVFWINMSMTSALYVDGNYDVNLQQTFRWAFQLFTEGDTGTSKALVSMFQDVPELSDLDWLIGTGRITTQSGTNYSGHDSGYVQFLYAAGLPVVSCFYVTLLFLCFRKNRYNTGKFKNIGYLLTACMFMLEIKEPFIFKYTVPFFTLSYLFLTAYEHEQRDAAARVSKTFVKK